MPASTISPISASVSPFCSFADGTYGEDQGRRGSASFRDDVRGNRGIVVRRLGIRHRRDGHKTARHRGCAAGRDRFRFLGSGLAEVNMNIEETGSDDQSGRVELRDIRGGDLSNRADLAVRSGCRWSRRFFVRDRSLDRSSRADPRLWPPSIKKRIAMRTATPADDLVENDGIRPVGHIGCDFNAAVHRPGMHDDRVWFCGSTLRARQPVIPEVFAHGREERLIHALELHAQHHDDIGSARGPHPSSGSGAGTPGSGYQVAAIQPASVSGRSTATRAIRTSSAGERWNVRPGCA